MLIARGFNLGDTMSQLILDLVLNGGKPIWIWWEIAQSTVYIYIVDRRREQNFVIKDLSGKELWTK